MFGKSYNVGGVFTKMIIPAYLIRVGIDSVRYNSEFKDLDPCARCEVCIRTVSDLFAEQVGSGTDPSLLESAVVAAYFAEFFHAAQPADGEAQLKDELIKQSGQHNAFESWQEWFTNKFAGSYKDDNIWIGLMMTSYGYTHQYELAYTEDAWEFRQAKSYLRTEQLWRLESHIETTAAIIQQIWNEEVEAYRNSRFNIEEYSVPYLGKPECIGFDTRRYSMIWPPGTDKPNEDLDVGGLVADIILPTGDDLYRQLDPHIFAGEHLDVTSLSDRAHYFFKSRRRLYDLSVGNDAESARVLASAEGWMVPAPN